VKSARGNFKWAWPIQITNNNNSSGSLNITKVVGNMGSYQL